MPHGKPDWGIDWSPRKVSGIEDLGEHAVRLRSPHLWDRRGDALYVTDFREGLGMFHTDFAGAGAGVQLVTGFSRQGAYAVMLQAGSDDDHFAYLHLAFPFQVQSAVGLEFSFSVAEWTHAIRAEFVWYDGVNERSALVEYNHVLEDLAYYHEPAGWTVLDDPVVLHECTRPEHTMKMVASMVTNRYLRFMLDDQIYTVFDHPVDEVLDNRPPYWYFVIWHFGVLLHTPPCFVDNVIVTQNEPT